MPKFYAAEDVTEPGTGIIALEDLGDRVKTMDLFPGLSLIQFDACQMFEKIRPDLFKSKVSAMREYFSLEAATSAHHSYKELGVPPAPVHFDMNPTNLLWDKEMRKLIAIVDYQLLHTGNFAEDIARTLMLTMSRQQRWSHTNALLKRYHDTLTSLSNGNPPYAISKVYEAYEWIFPYSMNFGLFAMANYFDMYNRLEQDEVKRREIQNEITDRAYGAIIDAERYIRLRQNSRSPRRV
ncbi:unnamed protein product [Cylicocyclus nassatus]|uniref:CHK kinase-like domain-containing protein n=1 Tax=Cylicocyclus nassatus TaxID=53992 RepID=A0AA36MIQ5_CYLNA|nr:unnamed protein product [Cylicocyclus nassatus]